jgi:hypothetical protein
MKHLFRGILGRVLRWAAIASSLALLVLGTGNSKANAAEPIVGYWHVLWTDSGGNVVFRLLDQFHEDGLENEVDINPVLIQNNCLGTWTHIKGRTYGLVHPYFEFDPGTGLLSGSGVYRCTVTVGKDDDSLSGKCAGQDLSTEDPFDPNPTVLDSFGPVNVVATRITVDKSQLP